MNTQFIELMTILAGPALIGLAIWVIVPGRLGTVLGIVCIVGWTLFTMAHLGGTEVDRSKLFFYFLNFLQMVPVLIILLVIIGISRFSNRRTNKSTVQIDEEDRS